MKKPIYKRKWFIALVVIVVLIAFASIVGGNGNDSEAPSANNDTSATASDSPTSAVPEDSTAAEEPKEPEVSQEFKNALSSAQTYSDVMHMSKQALYDQLTSEYGDKFPADAAQYAVDNVQADWNANALKSAETYYKDMSMSKDAVYDQLISEYGDQFTAEQAQYAVDHLE